MKTIIVDGPAKGKFLSYDDISLNGFKVFNGAIYQLINDDKPVFRFKRLMRTQDRQMKLFTKGTKMKLNKIAITGADDSTDPKDLVDISKRFPLVEWGILLSASKEGTPRFPSKQWLDKIRLDKLDIQLAGHVCGSWIKKLIVNNNPLVFKERPEFIEMFPRIQLNFSHLYSSEGFLEHLIPFKNQFIFQVNKYKTEKINLTKLAISKGINASILFDQSGGKGKLPNRWPEYPEIYAGYAGGLGPDSLEDELPKISQKVSDNFTWLDMESRIRTDDKLDLNKAVKCLEIIEAF